MAMPGWKVSLKSVGPKVRKSISNKKDEVKAALKEGVSPSSAINAAQIVEAQFCCQLDKTSGLWRFDRHKAMTFYDNDFKNYRVNGRPGHSYDPDARAAIYVATQGKNGLYPSLTPERGWYADPNGSEYADIATKMATKSADIDQVRRFFRMARMLPRTHVVVQRRLPPGILVFDFDHYNQALNEVCLEERRQVTEVLLQIKAEAPQGLPSVLGPKGIEALGQLKKGEALSAEVLITQMSDYSALVSGGGTSGTGSSAVADFYAFSQTVGNFALQEGIAMKWQSRHASMIPQLAYLEGSGNMALTEQDQGVIESVYFHDSDSNRLEKVPASDGALLMPAQGQGIT